MELYSKEIRNEIYKQALSYFDIDGFYCQYNNQLINSVCSPEGFYTEGICIAIVRAMKEIYAFFPEIKSDTVLIKEFPEVYDMLIECGWEETGYAFPDGLEWGHTIRVMILQQAIKQTK